jgi:zinc protease
MITQKKKCRIPCYVLIGVWTIFFISPKIFAQEKFRKSPPLPFLLSDLDFPVIKTSTQANGLEISVLEKSQPFIDMHLIIKTGESLSPDDIPGLASFTAEMLFKGAFGISAFQVEEQIEYIGGDFWVNTYPDYSIFSMTFLKDYLNEAFELLANLLIQPDFSRNEINNVKRDMFYEIVRNTNPELLGRKLLFQIIFDKHPYGKYVFNSSVIKKFNRKDLINFFGKFYRPNNSELIVIGDTNLLTVKKIADHYLNPWEREDLETYHINPPHPKTRPKICFTNLVGSEEVTIFVGYVIPKGNVEDYFSYWVFNQILGGSHISRLFMNLRETKGYAYWAFSNIELFENCGIFYVRAKVKPEYLYPSVEEILKEMNRLVKNKIPNHEIEQAKSYLIGNFPLRISEHREFSLKVSEIIALNMEEIYWGDYYENIMYINSYSVFKTLQKINFSNPVIVIIGDKSVALDYMKQFDEVEIYDHEGIYQYKLKKKEENH